MAVTRVLIMPNYLQAATIHGDASVAKGGEASGWLNAPASADGGETSARDKVYFTVQTTTSSMSCVLKIYSLLTVSLRFETRPRLPTKSSINY